MEGMVHFSAQTSLPIEDRFLEKRVGKDFAKLMRDLAERTRKRIIKDFNLTTLAFDSGAIQQVKANWEKDSLDMHQGDKEEHEYWTPRIDKANVATYDYAAVLFLNTQEENFQGGH